MELPKWNELLLNALKAYGDGDPHINRAIKVDVADSLNLPEELREEKTALHGDNKIEGRVGWAISALKIAGLLENYTRGSNIITEAGKNLLKTNPTVLTEQFLKENYASYKQNMDLNQDRQRNRRVNGENNDNSMSISDYTPEEAIDKGILEINSQLNNELLKKLRSVDPFRFEEVVADLLTAMGYGELTVTQKTNDGGIDAVVNEDKLGLDKILVQAKRYAEGNNINELPLRNFVGALATRNVNKGIFVTTSSFTTKAINAVNGMQMKVILIDGEKLAQLMIENNIGVAVKKSYCIKQIDSDFFDN
jgi:restriction system protein